MGKYSALSIFGALCCLAVVEMSVFTPEFESQLRSFVDTTMKCRHVPGLTLSVVKDSERWAKGFGKEDMSTGEPVTNSSVFNIGSITKSFTMALLGTLITKKGMNWKANVVDILGHDYAFIDDYRTQEITLRDLLSHRSGLSNLDLGVIAGSPMELSRAETARRMKFIPEAKPFRDSFIYSNYMYMVLGHVAEKIGGDTWENLVTSKLFKPIGMESSYFMKTPSDVTKDGVAKPYIYKDGRYENGTLSLYSLHPYEPAGAIMSTSDDMAKWMKFLLNNGKTEDGMTLVNEKLMNEAVIATSNDAGLQSSTLTKPTYPVSDTQMGYGYALFISTYRGYRRIWHSGGLYSYTSLFQIFPDKNIGIYGSVSGPGYKRLPLQALSTILYFISDHLLGEDPWLNETTTCSYPSLKDNTKSESAANEESSDIDNPSEYAGNYGNEYMPDVKIIADSKDTQKLPMTMSRLSCYLHSTSDKDRFLMEITEPWEIKMVFTNANNDSVKTNVTFIRDNGKIHSMKIGFQVGVDYTKGVSILDPIVSFSGRNSGSVFYITVMNLAGIYLSCMLHF